MFVMTQLFDLIASHPKLTPTEKAKFSLRFINADKRLVDGCDEQLQVLSLLSL